MHSAALAVTAISSPEHVWWSQRLDFNQDFIPYGRCSLH